MKRLGMVCALLMAPAAAMAGPGGSHVDVYYVPNPEIEIDDGTDNITLKDGSGFGLRGRFGLQDELFVQLEFQSNQYDKASIAGCCSGAFDSEATALRGGVGFSVGGPLYGLFEFIQQEIDLKDADMSFDDNGYGVHLGLQGGGESSTIYAQVGYVDIGDFGNGFEFLVGGALNFSPTTAVFVDYRNTTQEDDAGGEAVLTDLRVGVRFNF